MKGSPSFFAAIDCGTSSVKAGLFSATGAMRGFASEPCPTAFAADGAVTQDADLIVRSALRSLGRAVRLAGVKPSQVAALAVTNQRATVIPVDRAGAAAGPAISWQDMRGGAGVAALRRRIPDADYYAVTGLPNNAVFSLAKILWLRAQAPAAGRRAARYVLVHDYVLRRLGAPDFRSDWSNASLTGLLDVRRRAWSPRLLSLCGLREGQLPALVAPGAPVGALSSEAARRCGLSAGMPLIAGGGDQQCAGIGAGAVAPGIVEFTLGTAGVLLACAAKPILDPRRRVTCCAHAVAGAWEVEGLQNAAGASLQWIKRLTGMRDSFTPDLLRRMRQIGPGAGGLLFYPYLAGASAPHWNPDAAGMVLGLRLSSDPVALCRAVMEGVSFETRQILDVFRALRLPVREIRLTGGGASLDDWNQMQADIYGSRVAVLQNHQATLVGAAVLAAVGVGRYAGAAQAAARMVRIRRVYEPEASRAAEYNRIYRTYTGIYNTIDKAGVMPAVASRKGMR